MRVHKQLINIIASGAFAIVNHLANRSNKRRAGWLAMLRDM